jgi:hypothetical protein
MPVYNFDPSTVSVSFDVLPKGEYEFEIGEPKPFLRQNREGNDSYGIRYPLKAVREDLAKKRIQPYSCYMQSEGGQSFTKQFLMAALGYGKGPKEEQRFNTDMATADWSFNPGDANTAGECGEIWHKPKGSRIFGNVDVSKDEQGNEQQQFKGWRSILSQ